jgi:N-acetyl-anhydromuramyl-L-alanine amidase AmpD
MAPRIDRTLRLPAEEFFGGPEQKTGIAIHHTVGGSAASTFNWWKNDSQMIGTAYIIERDGTVFEVFDPAAWAWQFGLRWGRATKIRFERRFIGIELASEGGLIESEGTLYCFDRISQRTAKRWEEAFDFGEDYRGYRYFDRYEEAQIDALLELVERLCIQFQIKRRVPDGFIDCHGEALTAFEGIIGHAMVRKDKTDPVPDRSLWDRLIDGCGLAVTDLQTRGTLMNALTDAEIDQLFRHNASQIHEMNIAAGSMVKGLIMELERGERKTYIKLSNPAADGHIVEYEFLQGDRTLVPRIARALGFKTVTESRLEVRSA